VSELPNWYSRLRTEPFDEQTFTPVMMKNIEQRLETPRNPDRVRFVWVGVVAVPIMLGLFFVVLVSHPWERDAAIGIPEQSNSSVFVATPITTPITTPNITSSPTPKPIPYYATILDRMLDAVDNFSDVKGVYRQFDKSFGTDNTIRFEIEEGDHPGSYTTTEKTGEEGNPQTINAFDGENLIQLQPKEKIFRMDRFGNPPKKPEGPRFFKGPDGYNTWVGRGDPAESPAAEMILPSNYAFWTIDTETLKPTYQVTGHENFLGRDATIMEGNLDAYMGGKQKAKHYKYWVDSETGVLLKLELTNDSQEVVQSLEMCSITFNKGVDHSKFSAKAPEGWTDRSQIIRDKSKNESSSTAGGQS
jgi:hypothetical protein